MFSNSMQLIEYAFKNYQTIDIKTKIKEEFEKWKNVNQNRVVINKGVQDKIQLELEELNYAQIAVKNTEIDNIGIDINMLYYLEAPVVERKIIGNLKIMVGDETIEILEIYNTMEIRKKEIKDYMIEFLKLAQ